MQQKQPKQAQATTVTDKLDQTPPRGTRAAHNEAAFKHRD